ncbi:lysine-ketoglutarate reductase/saccharopine dehydrogenase bifunctional enzyme [Trifolium repens]|nr:lysine-ketoglutarate reductase/saccharopine dehydrogenase bifunctional enzyme [Trifolium repens]
MTAAAFPLCGGSAAVLHPPVMVGGQMTPTSIVPSLLTVDLEHHEVEDAPASVMTKILDLKLLLSLSLKRLSSLSEIAPLTETQTGVVLTKDKWTNSDCCATVASVVFGLQYGIEISMFSWCVTVCFRVCRLETSVNPVSCVYEANCPEWIIAMEILAERASLYDYELIVGEDGKRLLAFGNFAGRTGIIDFLCGLGHSKINFHPILFSVDRAIHISFRKLCLIHSMACVRC